ncbi:MAG: methionine adenosyltransferase [Geobacteraceae bacterium]|nr:methionine adenosyltransferase [Geobacteraceae bacterium]
MIVVEPYKGRSVREQKIEIVERKGTGHPDFICDSVMDAISVALSQEYLKDFGAILHHNIDKGLLAAGGVEKKYGGGRFVRPMELTIGDRATFKVSGREIPVVEIAVDAAKRWIRENLRFVDPEQHLTYRVVLAPGSDELTDLFSRPGQVTGANDTSAAVGYYPLSHTETVVLKLEKYLNSEVFKKKYPETGEDIKVMGLRQGNTLDVTVAMPLISQYVESESDYFARKGMIIKAMNDFLGECTGFKKIGVHYNTLDEKGRGPAGIYLTLTGTSAEDADSGQVGRGNRVNGLISMNRPMGTEAAAGKNPVSHVGKIYNVLSHKIAREIYEKVDGVKEVYVLLLSRIGTPIDLPQVAAAQILPEKGRKTGEMAGQVEQILGEALANIGVFCMELGRGVYPVC